MLERRLSFKFNICLLNSGETGDYTMGFHSDETTGRVSGTGVEIVSLGSVRDIIYRSKAQPEIQQSHVHRARDRPFLKCLHHWRVPGDCRRSCIGRDFRVLILSENETVLVPERTQMTESFFDHERLVVYRLAIEYVAESYRIAKSIYDPGHHFNDEWLRAAQSIPLNVAVRNGKDCFKDKNRFFKIARGSALERAAIRDKLLPF